MAVELIQLSSFLDSRLIPNEIFLEEREIDLSENDQEEKTNWNLEWKEIVNIASRYSFFCQSMDKQSLKMSGILNWIDKFGLQISQTARLCNDVGYYLNHQDDYAEVKKSSKKLILHDAIFLNNLGNFYREIGQYQIA